LPVLANAAREEYGSGRTERRTVMEFCSPNTNKPLHLGHLRNIAIGESLSRVRAFLGEQVAKTCVYNDRGIHICKSMLAYRLFGQNAEPGDQGVKPDHFAGDFYVLFAQKAKEDPALEEQAQQMLLQWEAGEVEIVALWRKMNAWALSGFSQTFQLFGTSFEREYYESAIYKQGKEIILDGLKRGIFSKRADGAVIVDLSTEGLDEKVLLRSNGTSVYMVQDIYLAFLKAKEFSYDQSVYVVGNEQEYHFKALKAILQRLGQEIGNGIHHLSYGMVELPEGKMKSREGTSVDADDLIRATALLAEEEVRKRYDLAEDETKQRALKIALAAIKYQLLKTDTGKNMLFNPKEAIRFEGDTGPYILYGYARASSILRKTDLGAVFEAWEADPYESRLLNKLDQFPELVQITGERLMPSLLAVYAFELAQIFNEFYHECPVLKSELAGYRLALVKVFKSVIGKCLDLMGIEKIEEM
jgi:arginyl-tRNA synthetase